MPSQPQNHVTHDLRARFKPDPERMPEVPLELLEWLEEVYPPQCYKHGEETLEDHLVYAGKVALIQSLRDRHQARVDSGEDDDGDFEFLSREPDAKG